LFLFIFLQGSEKLDIVRFAVSINKLDLSIEQKAELKRLEQEQMAMHPTRNNGYEQYAFYQNLLNLFLRN
jgi:hypothetical protein